MENTNPRADPMEIYNEVEAALTRINNARRAVNDPDGTKDEINGNLIQALTILHKVKADISALSVDVTVNEAIDYVVYNIDAQPREQHAHRETPNIWAPDWPRVREDYIRKVKSRLAMFFVQLGNRVYVTIDPELFQRQARQEASEVIYGLQPSS